MLYIFLANPVFSFIVVDYVFLSRWSGQMVHNATKTMQIMYRSANTIVSPFGLVWVTTNKNKEYKHFLFV